MDLTGVNLNLLHALAALLEEGSVSRAAARLHVTQSAMSKSLGQLRRLLGDPLLVRAGTRMAPTERALGLRAPLAQVLASVGALFSDPGFDPATCTRGFTVAVTDYVARYLLPDVLERVFREAPGVRVNAVAWRPELAAELGDGGIHLATVIVDALPPSIRRDRIDQDVFVCCLRRGHPLAGALTLDGYCAHPHAAITAGGDKVRVIDRALAALGRRRDVVLTMPYYEPAMDVAGRTDLLLTLPRHIGRNISGRYGLAWEELPFDAGPLEYSLIWHARYDNDPAHRWLRRALSAELERSLYSH
ncbi:MAG: LysR family transcriptional regulator [Deferrisomatales bacterium]